MTEKNVIKGWSFPARVIAAVGGVVLVGIAVWVFFNVRYQQRHTTETVVAMAEKLATTIRLGVRYAMMLNARDELNHIIENVSRQEDLKNLRIYNKKGVIKYSNHFTERNLETNIRVEACDVCHKTEPPLSVLDGGRRVRMMTDDDGVRLIGVVTPIYNEVGCAGAACHAPPSKKKILGALDIVISLEKPDAAIVEYEWGAGMTAFLMFFSAAAIIFLLVLKFIREPIKKLISGTELLTAGHYDARVDLRSNGELGTLAEAINLLGKTIGEKESALNKQRDDYQRLFEMVPCIVTVQDRDYRLISYNRQFAEKFNPKPGDYCYCAYKGRGEKCESCPVEKTFEDGLSHFSQETAFQQDGTARHWIVRTAPIKNADGDIVAAIEMSLDVTHRKLLQSALEESEKKYYAIFNNIANPIFVLTTDTLEVIDCNDAVLHVYGYEKSEMLQQSFLTLFREADREVMGRRIKEETFINQFRQVDKAGNTRFFNIRISPSAYPGRNVLLVTTSDITQWLETEQQLIQASKMATLGEMATGVAHELNQPLSVIKTAGSYFMKKVRNGEPIKPEILETMAEEIDSHVDRATKIINHMRTFGRKSSGDLARVQLNDILHRAFEIFSQQLKLREINVCWELSVDLPEILGDDGRLEQVFVNLFINARDAIEERFDGMIGGDQEKRIILRSKSNGNKVRIEVEDSGIGVDSVIAERVFEPFFTTKKVGQGTGLGLSISYGIVKDCGGDIDVVPGADGACFRLTFPVAEPLENGEAG